MTEPRLTARGTAAESLDGVTATGEPTLPPEAAAVLTAAGVGALTTKLANRWTLAGAAALAALVVGVVLVRSWYGPFTSGG